MRPVCLDFYCGLGGWAEGFLAEGVEVIGFDTERHDYGTGGYPGQLILQDVRTLTGAQFKPIADRICGIVASPPCTEYSYMAMPWKRAKQIARALRGNDEFPSGYKGSRSIEELNLLFNECFRIQREASEVAGRHIPLIVENVKGAQPWVGRAPWNFGSFYLWGDVPALMPIPSKLRQKFNPDGTGHPPGSWFAVADSKARGAKSSGQDWSRFAKTGEVSPHWRLEAQKNNGGSWFNVAHNTMSGHAQNPDGRKIPTSCSARRWEDREVKRLRGTFGWSGSIMREGTNHGEKRKKASAMIAKIPLPLARHIARCFVPQEVLVLA